MYFEDKEWAKAIGYLEKCVNQSDSVWYGEADLLDNLSFALQKDSEKYSLEDSIKYCERLIDINPDSGVYARIGHAFHLQGDYNKAITSFKKSLEYEPTNTDAANDLAKSYAFSGKHKELREYIDNPPISLRKHTLEIAERELSKQV